MTQQPDPPNALPNYIADGLPKQDDQTLVEAKNYIEDLLAYRTEDLGVDELPDDAEPVETDSSGKGTLVKEKVTCGDDSCSCMSGGEKHGPYLYRYYREGDELKSEYIGKPGDE